MNLVRERYIHSHLQFDEAEKDILTSACKIVSKVRDLNVRGYKEDEYLRERCTEIVKGISELLNNYSNEYMEE